ncbi:hypothetical protein Poli38472_013001 [Pythium oligandrum]|uniref:Calmodulin n=1 Tax=Pythium oligandrum TaxID=41045 RepID=A0A8K1FKN5_PYTOL|nr:hypothetical protein Poli38472_013001 [Pythium oligandrum]|eukprot:TMW64379.1 hypothetical protein Poli38472_013001 [Pythium oligandrum]
MRVHVKVGPRETWIPSLPESLRHEFAQDELEQMLQQFCDFDASGDGSIAATELVTLMKSMGVNATLDEVQALIDKVDENRSGELEFPEFVRLLSEFRRGHGDKLAAFIQYSKLALAIRQELLDLQTRPSGPSRVFPVKESAWEWRVELEGPLTSPYEGGVFQFHVRFGHEYPYEAPVLTCLTHIYHPNFVPLLNGTMVLYGVLEQWEPEWRMRGLLERLQTLLVTPDVDLMDAFYDESSKQLGLDTSNDTTSTKRRLRHPREFTLECIDTYVTDPERFFSVAQHMTRTCAQSKGQ